MDAMGRFMSLSVAGKVLTLLLIIETKGAFELRQGALAAHIYNTRPPVGSLPIALVSKASPAPKIINFVAI